MIKILLKPCVLNCNCQKNLELCGTVTSEESRLGLWLLLPSVDDAFPGVK